MYSCISKRSYGNPVTSFPIIECEYLSEELDLNSDSATSQLVPSAKSLNSFEFIKKVVSWDDYENVKMPWKGEWGKDWKREEEKKNNDEREEARLQGP